MKRNLFSLRNFTDLHSPHLIFLSEPQLFQSDLPLLVKYFKGEYSVALNSEDLHKPELSLTSSRAKGGTMVLWSKKLDPYLTVHLPKSASFLPVVLDIPGWTTMVHVSVYLPTAGKEAEFLTELASLRIMIETLLDKYSSPAVFIRGDCNSSTTNAKRNIIFSKFCSDLGLRRVHLQHNTYHHFLGQGASDSELDVLLFSNQQGVQEELLTIVCKHDNPLVDSHHDILLSVCDVPALDLSHHPPDDSKNVLAPKLVNTRHKILWTEESVIAYESLVSSHLPRIRELWLNISSETSMKILLQVTNMILSQSALLVNKSVLLSTPSKPKSAKIPPYIRKSNASLVNLANKLRTQSQDPRFSVTVVEQTRYKYKQKKAQHRRLVRRKRLYESNKRDQETFSIFSNCSNTVFQNVRSAKKSSVLRSRNCM